MKKTLLVLASALLAVDNCLAQWIPSRMGAPRRRLGAAATATHVYFAGGRNSLTPSTDLVDVFETATGIYSTLQLPLRRYDVSGVGFEGRAFFAGGRLPITDTPVDRLDVWNEATQQWASYNMPFPTWGASIEVQGGRVYVPSGIGSPVPIVQVFDVATETFSVVTLSGIPRFLQRSACDERWLCLFGGAGSSVAYLIDVYDSVTGAWSQVTAPVYGSRGTVIDGRLYLVGLEGVHNTSLQLEIFDLATQSWTRERLLYNASLPFLGSSGPFVVVANGRGRTSAPQALLDSSMLYDTWSGAWSALLMHSTGRDRATAIQRETGRFYVAGGQPDNGLSGVTLDTIDILELETDMGQAYCPQSSPNSIGQVAELRLAGSRSVVANVVALAMHRVPPGTFGFFLVGTGPAAVVNPGATPGTLCVGGTFGRLSRQVRAADERGILGIRLDLHELPLGSILRSAQPGETLHVQSWYRDQLPGTTAPTSRLSDARWFTVTN